MKTRTLKLLSLLMSLCLLAGSLSLAACSTPNGEQDTTDGGSIGETETEEDPRATLDNPEVNYDGYTFRVRSIASETHYTALDPGKLTGEAVNDAIYERNRKIESEYGIEFRCDTSDITANYVTMEKQVMAGTGDDGYDLIMLISRNAFSAALQNYLINYEELPYVDTDKEYYFGEINK